jgi:hypothetical protein
LSEQRAARLACGRQGGLSRRTGPATRCSPPAGRASSSARPSSSRSARTPCFASGARTRTRRRRPAGRPALRARDLSWPKSGPPHSSPPAGCNLIESANLLGDETGDAGGMRRGGRCDNTTNAGHREARQRDAARSGVAEARRMLAFSVAPDDKHASATSLASGLDHARSSSTPTATRASAPVAAPPTRATARVRLQAAADRAAIKHIGDSRNRGKAGPSR